MKRKVISLALILMLALVTLGNKDCGGSDMATRAVRAVSAIPAVVRVLYPNAKPEVFTALDASVKAFNIFINDKTSSNWEKAEEAWGIAKGVLLTFNNQRLNQIIAVVDILLTQVDVPIGHTAGNAPVKVKFDEAKVRELESLVKVN